MTTHATSLQHPRATGLGLAIALIASPAIVAAFRIATGENHSDLQIICRELVLLALAGLLLWLVRAREQLPLTSIGLRTDRPIRSILWGLAWTALLLIVTVGLQLTLQQLGIRLGAEQAGAFHPSLGVVALVVLRAGIVEEIFYRGYAIERLQVLTGSRWIACLLPLACFAASHYRQGPGGIFAVAVLGGLFTVLYLWRRDLIANITAHFATDFVLNIVLPLIGAD